MFIGNYQDIVSEKGLEDASSSDEKKERLGFAYQAKKYASKMKDEESVIKK